MQEFFTREKANEGIQVPLWRPDGTKSEHWIRIRGIDSDIFREADAMARREAVGIASVEDPAERSRQIAALKRRLSVSLVVDWSFPEECTKEAVEKFFIEAPQIMDAIDTASGKRALFFASESSNSQPLPSTASS